MNTYYLNKLYSCKTKAVKAFVSAESFCEHRVVQVAIIGATCFMLADPICAAITGDMKAAVEGLQKEIFGDGWVTIAKIAAAGTGVVMSIARSSLMPFGTGAAVAVGIHFFQKHTEAAAAFLC
jgi:hypothetical protein